MSRLLLTNRAENDLVEIFIFGIEQFGENQAQLYSIELENCFDLIAQNPQIGRLARALGDGVRRHEHKSHVIIYEISDFGILILAIVHKANIKRLKLD